MAKPFWLESTVHEVCGAMAAAVTERPALDCPGAHGLQSMSTPEPGRLCDICSETIKPGCEAFACLSCGFDVCVTCMEHGLTKADCEIEKMRKKISGYAKQQQAYADDAKQTLAKASLPQALLDMAKSFTERELLLELLKWFKADFFRWLDKPCCEHCPASSGAKNEGMTEPSEEDGRVMFSSCDAYMTASNHGKNMTSTMLIADGSNYAWQ